MFATMGTHFEAIGLPSSAPFQEVRQRLLTLARQNHPDVSGETSDIVRFSSAWDELKKHFHQQGKC